MVKHLHLTNRSGSEGQPNGAFCDKIMPFKRATARSGDDSRRAIRNDVTGQRSKSQGGGFGMEESFNLTFVGTTGAVNSSTPPGNKSKPNESAGLSSGANDGPGRETALRTEGPIGVKECTIEGNPPVD